MGFQGFCHAFYGDVHKYQVLGFDKLICICKGWNHPYTIIPNLLFMSSWIIHIQLSPIYYLWQLCKWKGWSTVRYTQRGRQSFETWAGHHPTEVYFPWRFWLGMVLLKLFFGEDVIYSDVCIYIYQCNNSNNIYIYRYINNYHEISAENYMIPQRMWEI